jgi:hypothetical protein
MDYAGDVDPSGAYAELQAADSDAVLVDVRTQAGITSSLITARGIRGPVPFP